MFDENSILEAAGADDKDILPPVIQLFQDRWITAFDYNRATPVAYRGAALPDDLRENTDFMRIVMYVERLFSETLDTHGMVEAETLPKLARREVMQADRDGGLCIYLSVLMYCLLLESKVATPDQLRLVQGFYRHKLREDFPFPWGEYHSGLHCWLALDDAVLDISIRQEEMFFDFGSGAAYVVGPVPDGLDLVGFAETKKTAMKYARNYAKAAGLKYEAWIRQHTLDSFDVAKNSLEGAIKEYEQQLLNEMQSHKQDLQELGRELDKIAARVAKLADAQ